MKQLFTSFLIFFSFLNYSFGQTTIWSEDFSTSPSYTVSLGGEGNDGTSDYFQKTTTLGGYTGASGTYFAAQDVDDGGWSGSANPSQLTWTGINISSYSNLTFSGDFASSSTSHIDASDFVIIEVNIDAVGWNTILQFENDGTGFNTEFLEDTDFNGIGDGTNLTGNFLTFNKNISGTGTSIDIRITVSVNAGGEDFGFDEFQIAGIPSCTPPTITSITPTSGPAGTLVNINATGGGFTGSTAVTFDGTPAASFTVVSNTLIQAVVPVGATSGDIVVTDSQPCDASFSSFTVLDSDISGCEGSTPIFSDLFISEVYDAGSGDTYYYEIYNGTGASVNLANYRIHQNNNGTFDQYYNLSGTLADGDTYVVGNSTSVCSGVVDLSVSGTGINTDDGIWLETSAGTQIDKWGTPGVAFTPGTGYHYRRKASPVNTPPYTGWDETGDWDQSGTESCADLGNYTLPSSGAEPTVTSHPTTSQLCNNGSTSLTAAGTEGFAGGLPLAYQWYVSAPNTAGWTALTNTGVYTGATAATLNISNTAGLDGYQYYCQIRENAATCYSATNAVQLDVFGVGGTAGLWRGTTSTDWCNCFNWDDGTVPNNATNVTINQTASNNCVVAASCASATAGSVTISSNSATNRLLTITNGGVLNIIGNLVINKTAGTFTLIVETTGTGSLTSTGVSIDGSAGTNAVLRNNSATATLDINGNLTINANGSLDLNANGILNLAGNFINNNSAAAFDEANSRVIFDGNTAQTINTNAFTEVFHDITVNKSGGTLTLQDPVTLDASGNLVLTNGQMVLNGLVLTVNNPATTAISRTNGSIVEESGATTGNNSGKISWNMGATTGAHVFPFASGVGGTYIPFTFELSGGNAGIVSLSTYHTPANNLPWPSSPELVTNLNSTAALAPDNRTATVDRFWQIDKTGATGTADLTFGYMTSELPVAPYNVHTNMIAQRYNSTLDQWETQIYPGQTRGTIAGGYFVKVPNISVFSPWTLANLDSPLPAELTYFDAKPNGNKVFLDWETESEINVSHFIIERSKDGELFNPILSHEAAGNSNYTINYNTIDYQPLSGVSYYRLLTYDYDGSFKVSQVETVNFENNSIGVFYDDENWVVNYKTDSKSLKVDIVNALGAIVYSNVLDANDNGIHISKSNMASGMYFIIVHDGMTTQSIKVFK